MPTCTCDSAAAGQEPAPLTLQQLQGASGRHWQRLACDVHCLQFQS